MFSKSITIKTYRFILSLSVLFSLTLNGCAPEPSKTISLLSSSKEAVSSVQLLPDRSLSTLEDRLLITRSKHEQTPIFQVLNETGQALSVTIRGSNIYSTIIHPRKNHAWRVIPGQYRIELHLPGLPPASAENVSISSHNRYEWKIWRSEYKK